MQPFYDQSNIVNESMASVRDAIVIGLFLAGLIIWLFLRDWRSQDQTVMDRTLFDIIWEVYRDVDGKQPIQIISAYRAPATNAMLRRRSSGVARRTASGGRGGEVGRRRHCPSESEWPARRAGSRAPA